MTAPRQETGSTGAEAPKGFFRKYILPLVIGAGALVGFGVFSQSAFGSAAIKSLGERSNKIVGGISEYGRRGLVAMGLLAPASPLNVVGGTGTLPPAMKKHYEQAIKTNPLAMPGGPSLQQAQDNFRTGGTQAAGGVSTIPGATPPIAAGPSAEPLPSVIAAEVTPPVRPLNE